MPSPLFPNAFRWGKFESGGNYLECGAVRRFGFCLSFGLRRGPKEKPKLPRSVMHGLRCKNQNGGKTPQSKGKTNAVKIRAILPPA
jgi:hypothetical protein